MICVSIAEAGLSACLAALNDVPFAEIRLDMADLTPPEVWTLFSSHKNLIATCRPGRFPDAVRKALLLEAIGAGAAFVDVEVDAPARYRGEVVRRAKTAGCAVIVSFHDYEKTPDRGTLERIVSASFRIGADIAKIACMVKSAADNARLVGLLDDGRKIVVVGMGEAGRVTRVAAPLSGSPFTFASLAEGKETADGQIDRETLKRILAVLAPRSEGTP